MPLEIFTDVMHIGSNSSLILTTLEGKIALSEVCSSVSSNKKALENLGLFDTAAPNFNTYNPSVDLKDIFGADSEGFVFPIFRGLSEVIVNKKSRPTDFTKNSVLKNSVGKFRGLAVYPNHEMTLGNELGVITEDYWQESYTTDNGILVPAGINLKLRIDGKAHTNIARGVMSNPPSIHSGSATVEFQWEKSHPKLTNEEFVGKVGTYGSDKELIRRIATEVNRYYEYSLVPHGADPFAQKVKAGQIVNDLYAASRDSYSSGFQSEQKIHYFSFKETETFGEAQSHKDNKLNPTKNKEKMREILLRLALSLALTPEATATEEQLTELVDSKIKENLTNATKVNKELLALNPKVSELETSITGLNAEIVELKKPQPELVAMLTAERNEVVRLYNLSTENKPDEPILKLIASGNFETLTALKAQYSKAVKEEFSGKCAKCGSTEITHQHSEGGGKGTDVPKTMKEKMKAIQTGKLKSQSPMNAFNIEVKK